MNIGNDASRRPFFSRHKKLFIFFGALITVVALTALAFRLSPVPGAFIIKYVFNQDAQEKRTALEAHTPRERVVIRSDIPYLEKNDMAKLDVYIPQRVVDTDTPLPTIIWTHGGAWLSGDKTDAAPYFKLLADRGFTVIAPNYSLAPGKTYPTQVTQLIAAHSYILKNATVLHVDPTRIILAGDSAGAQLSAQLAALSTNPTYAHEIGITPSLTEKNIAATVLYCGIYDLKKLATPYEDLPKIVGWGIDVTVWSYSGTRDPNARILQRMSPINYVTRGFPKTFISGGNADPLTKSQSEPFAQILKRMNVETTTLFYPDSHPAQLSHENQFVLDKDGLENFESLMAFLDKL